MKKILSIIFAGTVAVFASVSCQKEEKIDASQDGSIHFFAKEIATKTEFGEVSANKYPTLWTSNEKVKISLNGSDSAEPYDVTPSVDQKTAVFTNTDPTKSIKDDASGNYVFYALSPAAAKVSVNSSQFNITFPASQTPKATSVDEKAQILFAKHDAGTTYPASVSFNFSHLAAYGKISFSNLTLDGDENISSVTIESPVDWLGRWQYAFADGTYTANSTSRILTLTTTSMSDIWFACKPVNLEGKTIIITVATNKGTFTRNVTFPSGKGNFEAGKIGAFTVNMSGVTRVSPIVYTLVTDVSDLTLGSEVIIVASDADYAISTTQNGNNRAQASITKSGSTISDPGSSVQVFTIGNGTRGGTYSFFTGTKYIYAISGNNYLRSADALDIAGSWGISISEGKAAIQSVGTTDVRTIRYNSGSSLFSCYQSGQGDVSIYKKNGTGSGAINAKTTIMTVSDATTTFSVGDTFTFDGTVKAGDSDRPDFEMSTLTSSQYTVDNSAVDMAAAGTYTVTISYNANPSVTTSYQITVSSNAPSTVTFVFNTDAGLSELGISKPATSAGTNLGATPYVLGDITLTATDGGTATRVWNSAGTLDLRIYKNGGTLTFTASGSKKISSIVLSGGTVGGFTANVGTFSAGTWTGNASSVTLTATGTEKINTIAVTYL